MRLLSILQWALLSVIVSTQLSAQNTPTTYSLEIHSIISDYGNTLGPVAGQTITNQWPTWQKVAKDQGDYHIRVDFTAGLDPKQYRMRKAASRQYIYDVKYTTPNYEAIVTNKNGTIILQKSYGGETNIAPFGEDDQYASPDTIADSWNIYRETFYEIEEAKFNNTDEMLNELATLINNESTPLVATISTIDKPLKEIVAPKLEKEKVVLDVTPTEDIPNKTNTEQITIEDINEKADQEITPQTPDRNLELEDDEPAIVVETPIDTPTPYTKPEEQNVPNNSNTDIQVEEKDKELVAGETPPVPTPQKRKEETEIDKTDTPKETDAERTARLERIQKEWDEMDKEDEEKNKRPRVRYVRLGVRTLIPNIIGGHGEIVLPMLNNRFSIVGDFSQLNFGWMLEPFLDEDDNIENIDIIYRYFSVGTNFYFRKKYARGWYIGASYLKNIGITRASELDGDDESTSVDIDSAALRFGVTTGRRTFMFGFEIGAGIPLGNLKGEYYEEVDGIRTTEQVDEKYNAVVPILNITLGVAL